MSYPFFFAYHILLWQEVRVFSFVMDVHVVHEKVKKTKAVKKQKAAKAEGKSKKQKGVIATERIERQSRGGEHVQMTLRFLIFFRTKLYTVQ